MIPRLTLALNSKATDLVWAYDKTDIASLISR
jgi:hypothetical protein